ncbi:glycosyl transferase family group 2-domain-containing protein [Cladochytrium replicatum]|nr:glycosyl transferase family group 2-domain-containing protein [Cladochytrium replicatum]
MVSHGHSQPRIWCTPTQTAPTTCHWCHSHVLHPATYPQMGSSPCKQQAAAALTTSYVHNAAHAAAAASLPQRTSLTPAKSRPQKPTLPHLPTLFPYLNGRFLRCETHCSHREIIIAMVISSKTVRTALDQVEPDANALTLKSGSQLQILDTLDHLPRARKHQWSALIRDERALVVWGEHIEGIVESALEIDKQVFNFVWEGVKGEMVGGDDQDLKNKSDAILEEGMKDQVTRRPYQFTTIFVTTIAMAVLIIVFSFGFRSLVVGFMIDGNPVRFAVLAVLPIQLLFAMFVPCAGVSSLMQIVGPVSQVTSNSVYFSGRAEKRLNTPILPHVTIQIPVYTESLTTVIHPTIQSVKKCITTYERQGGTASIYINDDGMRVISEQEAQTRREYYQLHSIGWCARPKHNSNGYVRRGRFKKASNLNFSLRTSRKVEELVKDGMDYYDGLEKVVAEDGLAWAGGNILVGDFILQLDADTRVPEDCLLDAVSEMVASPECAILQFESGVMYVIKNYWENGIGHFTDFIYGAIKMATAGGEVAPFVGHNAMLRWSAMQEVAFEEDGEIKYWSESHVSEDFDMALRLQIVGYIVRYVAYTGKEFQEGVSLTVDDEIKRWQKYAYGCSELVFNPISKWFTRGLFTKLWLKFLRSNISFSYKITMVAYIGTYYAIGAVWLLTLINYFICGYWADLLDSYYVISYNVLFTTIVIFTFLSNIAHSIMQYRVKERGFFDSLLRNVAYVPFFTVFFSGLSWHLCLSLLAHLVGYNMSWSTTAKEVEKSSFFIEAPGIFKRYKSMYVVFTLLLAMMPVMAYAPPVEWRIDGFTTLFPLVLIVAGHLLLPIVLNPYLMTFTF